MATAISLAERGVQVDLIDLDAEWRVYGAGITITGPTLRAYRRLGLLEPIKQAGAITNKTHLYRYDGTLLHALDEPVIEEGLPATGGIMRPVLHKIMQKRIHELDIPVRLGLTVTALDDDESGVEVVLRRYEGALRPRCWRGQRFLRRARYRVRAVVTTSTCR